MAGAGPAGPRLRAAPTRQLHITAGNTPLVPFVSAIWAFATKGAAVIKSPETMAAAAAILGYAIQSADPEHPLARHTSVVYWRGGDRQIEDALFAPGAFDRIVAWGSQETMDSVAARAGSARCVLFQPRYGVSLIGREAFPGQVAAAAARAAADSMVANQAACAAALVHYVEGSEEDTLAYGRALQGLLWRWDQALPHRPARAGLGKLRLLRRGAWAGGTWFENGAWPDISSLVVYLPGAFDPTAHPLGRCVVVRRVDDLREALPQIDARVSTVGVYPEGRREALRDELAGRGVSSIMPLGECERAYAGMPHDGMRVLNELVSWTNA